MQIIRQLKRPFKIVATTLIIGQILYIYLHYITYHKSSWGIYNLENLVNTAVGMQYYPEKYVNFKSNSPELKSIAPEDWYKVKCNQAGSISFLRNLVGSYEKFLQIPIAQRKQLDCLMIRFLPNLDKYPDIGISKELDSDYFNRRKYSLFVEDYVFEKPDILWNILKVIERPCDYIDTLDNVKKKVRALNLQADNRYTDEQIAEDLDNYKYSLGCDGKRKHWWLARREYIILNVVSSDAERRVLSIVVKRKDI